MIWLTTVLALTSLLAVFQAPAKPLWFLAIGVTEGGHFIAILAALIALATWWERPARPLICALACMAAILYLTPVIRASLLARTLPIRFALVFGNARPRETAAAPARRSPLIYRDLFGGIASPAVHVSSCVYATRDDQRLSLDVYSPEGIGHAAANPPPRPWVLVIHGGSWQSGTRQELHGLNRYLAARGYVVAIRFRKTVLP